MPKTEKKSNNFPLIDLIKAQFIWYLINFLIIFFQTYVSPDELPYLEEIYFLIFSIIGQGLFISFLLYWTTMIYELSFAELGINLNNFLTNLKLGLKISCPFLIGIIFIHLILTTEQITPLIIITDLDQLASSLLYFLLLFIGYLVPAFSKELFYRGFIYYQFRQNYGLKLGFLASLIYYTVSYLDFRLSSLLIHFIVGAITTYLSHKTDSLLAATIFRSTYQASLTLYLFSFSNWQF
ncbi:CPBP family glutamic-type intramembrane protease [Natroniella sulfidigena]|uniref:CPBP family intramembrane glutamic endopeptidase n=1 Tax=Natroniella sulfidigena TaxID=723921 RepID=UPI00200A48E0|nr:CPBP family intramembrane glutamic endopeptidase [Natroniella sulfidigena]MCK8816171.1 CPBP family glutamic-type intramembrane protease [Natroniella sulfidigena]